MSILQLFAFKEQNLIDANEIEGDLQTSAFGRLRIKLSNLNCLIQGLRSDEFERLGLIVQEIG